MDTHCRSVDRPQRVADHFRLTRKRHLTCGKKTGTTTLEGLGRKVQAGETTALDEQTTLGTVRLQFSDLSTSPTNRQHKPFCELTFSLLAYMEAVYGRKRDRLD